MMFAAVGTYALYWATRYIASKKRPLSLKFDFDIVPHVFRERIRRELTNSNRVQGPVFKKTFSVLEIRLRYCPTRIRRKEKAEANEL